MEPAMFRDYDKRCGICGGWLIYLLVAVLMALFLKILT
jgi:hypothetical protein